MDHAILVHARPREKEDPMLRSVRFVIAVIVVFGILLSEPSVAQQGAQPGLSLNVVGIGTKDYAESLNFYTKVVGLRAAFSFSPNGKTTNTYLQVSRDTFLELQETPVNPRPGLTHIHMRTEDVD